MGAAVGGAIILRAFARAGCAEEAERRRLAPRLPADAIHRRSMGHAHAMPFPLDIYHRMPRHAFCLMMAAGRDIAACHDRRRCLRRGKKYRSISVMPSLLLRRRLLRQSHHTARCFGMLRRFCRHLSCCRHDFTIC